MALPASWQLGYLAGRWTDVEGNPWAGKRVNFALASGRASVDGTLVVDEDGITVDLDADGQLSGVGVETVNGWNVMPFPVSTDADVQPIDNHIRVTELMPGGVQFLVALAGSDTKSSPLVVTSGVAALFPDSVGYYKPVWWQEGTAIPAGAVVGRDLLYDYTTTELYAITAD